MKKPLQAGLVLPNASVYFLIYSPSAWDGESSGTEDKGTV